MSAAELLRQIRKFGGNVQVAPGDKLYCEKVPQDLVTELKRLQPDVIREIQKETARFHCTRCNAHVDTSAGYAKHYALGCDYVSAPVQEKTLPSCSKCGGYYLYHGRCVSCQPLEGDL